MTGTAELRAVKNRNMIVLGNLKDRILGVLLANEMILR